MDHCEYCQQRFEYVGATIVFYHLCFSHIGGWAGCPYESRYCCVKDEWDLRLIKGYIDTLREDV